jgi:SAM-dependent methyltransferase
LLTLCTWAMTDCRAVTGSEDPSLWYKAAYAVRHPRRALRYTCYGGRDALLGLKSLDHLSYYRAAMRSGATRNPELAVGSRSHEEWLKHGQLQFDYLMRHGLRPSDRMLEIGCGNLRAGRLFIDYLEPGNYYGLDISPDILLDGQRTLTELGLQAKFPHLALVSDLTFGFLPAAHFSVVHAHSVFSHSPRHVIAECLSNVGRVMAPGAFFDFTFHRTAGSEHHLLGWAFYYRSDTLLGLARSHGLDARIMTDWKSLGGPQSKMRVTAPSAGVLARSSASASSRPCSGLSLIWWARAGAI